MVKLCIICYSIHSYGAKSLVAYLKEHTDAEIKLLLFPHLIKSTFSDHVVEQVVQECRGFDIVGFSLFSDFYKPTIQLTEALKNKVGVEIIYGGIHATACPQQCLKYADAVCVGEGEEAMAELVNRYDKERVIANDIDNIYVKDKVGNIISNTPRPLIANLDKIPTFHFWETEERIFHNGCFKDATVKLYKHYLLPHYYLAFASRGCAFACTFCCNNVLRQIYKGQKLLRWKSWDYLFAELHHIKSALPFLKCIGLVDDLFIALPLEDMEAFCSRYRKEVNMPLYIPGLHPSLVTAEKVELLVDAGAVYLGMGIQSGCQKTLDLYQRRSKVEEITKATNLLRKHAKGVSIVYDFILDNPFEKDEDVKETLRLVGKLQKPFKFNLSTLIFYPGTRLYDMAIENGLISTEEVPEEGFALLKSGYYNDLFRIISTLRIPSKIWDILVERKRGYRVWHKLLFGIRLVTELFVEGIGDISRTDFRRICRFLANPRYYKSRV